MLFKRNDKIAIVVKPKTHNGFVNQNDYYNRYGDFREGSKFLVSKTLSFIGTLKQKTLGLSI